MRVKIVELLRQNVSVRDKVELIFTEPFLHLYEVVAQAIFSCDLITLREVIYALVFVQALVHVTFAR